MIIFIAVYSRGMFQSTFIASARASGEKVSVKEHHLRYYPKNQNQEGDPEHDATQAVATEVLFLSKMNHVSIPKLREIFITEASLFIVMDYIDPFRLSNFVNVKDNKTLLNVSESRRIMKSIVSAVHHCHEHGIIVRELTPNNIMVKKAGVDSTGHSCIFDVMLVDFSLSVVDGSTSLLADHPIFEWSMVPYTAPEALLNQPYSTSMDMWSLGVVLFSMLSGHLPFNNEDDHLLVSDIKTANFEFDEDCWNSVPQAAKMLIGELLHSIPTDRLTAKQAMKSSWLVIG